MSAVSNVRTLEQKFLVKDGAIDPKEATKLLAAATDGESKTYLRDMLSRDKFIGGADTKIAKKVVSNKGGRPQELGTIESPNNTVRISVKRELSPAEGYGDAKQARAAAVVSGVPAAIIKDANGRWRAYAVDLAVSNTKNDVKEGELPKAAKGAGSNLVYVSPADTKMDWKQEIANLKALEATDVKPAELDAAYKKILARALNVDESTINVARGPGDYKKGMVNFDLQPLDGGIANGITVRVSPDKDHKPVYLPNDKTTEIQPSMVVIGRDALKGGMVDLQGTYLHELTHQGHEEAAEKLLGEWRKSKTDKSFVAWAESKGADATTIALTAGAVHGTFATTEFLAHAEEFMGVFARLPKDDKRFMDLDDANGRSLPFRDEKEKHAIANKEIERMQRWAATLEPKQRDELNAHLRTYKTGNFAELQV